MTYCRMNFLIGFLYLISLDFNFTHAVICNLIRDKRCKSENENMMTLDLDSGPIATNKL